MGELSIILNGVCIVYDFRGLLLIGSQAEEVARQPGWTIAAQGDVTLALGLSLFDRPFVFTPRSIITERNQEIVGEAMFDWLAERGYDMPRSEVFGVNARGSDDLVYAREVDIEASPIALLGQDTWVIGWVEVDPALRDRAEPADRSDLPHRFQRALKHYRAGPTAKLSQLL